MSETFTVSLGGCSVSVSCLYPSTRDFLREYVTQAPADFSLRITPYDIEKEQELSDMQDASEGIPKRTFSKPYLETLALYRKLAEELPTHGTFLIHGSAVAVDGEGYLFCAKSGTGKSTHTALWREKFGSRAVMVNDDKPLVRVAEKGVLVYGTPWDGKHRLSTPVSVPLRSVCLLSRGEKNEIEKIDVKDAFSLLLSHIYRPSTPLSLACTLELLSRLLTVCPAYALKCNRETESADVSFSAMTNPNHLLK